MSEAETEKGWYRNLPPHKREVINVVMILSVAHIFLNLIYFIPAGFWTFNLIEWNILILGGYTSVGALYLALKTRYSVYSMIDMAKAEIYERLGITFVSRLVEVGQKLDMRFAGLSPKQRESIIELVSRTADVGFDKLKELTQPRPPPPRKKIIKLEEGKVKRSRKRT